MANATEPKKETVCIAVPPAPVANPVPPNDARHDTELAAAATAARSNVNPPNLPGLAQAPKPPLPPRPPAIEPIASATQSPQAMSFKPPPPNLQKPVEAATASRFPATQPTPALASPGPKKETARIEVAPEPKSTAPKAKMSKTQPLIITPAPSAKDSPVLIAPENSGAVLDSIPMSLCWALLAVSIITFIIQLWTYFF